LRMLLACIEMLRFGIPRHAQSASIGENSGEILRSVCVRLNIAVEFEEIQRIANLAPRLPLAGSDLAADYYIELSALRRPLISRCRLRPGCKSSVGLALKFPRILTLSSKGASLCCQSFGEPRRVSDRYCPDFSAVRLARDRPCQRPARRLASVGRAVEMAATQALRSHQRQPSGWSASWINV
jgi:hypothetical protein